MDLTTLFNNPDDTLKSWMFNNKSDEETKTMAYSIPVLLDNDPIVQCALNAAVVNVLETFQTSLSDEGYREIESVVKMGATPGYINTVTEVAMSETFYSLERMIDDNETINYDYGYNVTGNQMMDYITDNVNQFQEKITQFAFLVFTGVISNLIETVKGLETCGIVIGTYLIKQSFYDQSTVHIDCYIDRTKGLLIK